MYLDPPYLMDRRHTYSIDANDLEFHEELLKACIESKAMLIISGYKNSLYSKYLNPKNGWTGRRITTTTRGTNGLSATRVEMLWVNAPFKKAKRSGKVPLILTESESTEKKINPERKSVKRSAPGGLLREG